MLNSKKIHLTTLFLLLAGCSQSIEQPFFDRSQQGADGELRNRIGPEAENPNSSDFWLRTGDNQSFFKRGLLTDTAASEDLNIEYCVLDAGSEIDIQKQAEMVNDDSVYVYLKSKVSADCPLEEGYLYIGNLERVSHEIKIAESRSETGNPSPVDAPEATPAPSPYESPAILNFPLNHKPYKDFLTAPRSYKSNRDGGRRWHAAADLYSATGEDVKAIADGKVIDYHYFYSGTYAVVVEHPEVGGMKIVRYGEIGGLETGIKIGKIVRRGDVLAKVGKLSCCHAMLHFEGYTGEKTGPLTTSGNKYKRRSDLVNPTKVLTDLENKDL